MTSPLKPARVRFAPSPTGRLHIGGARTALYNYLLARQTGGQFILRLEDSDRMRLVPGTEEEIIHTLRWLGLEWDEGIGVGGPYGPYRQSECKELYQEHARKLIEAGHAYYCFCTPERLDQVRREQIAQKTPSHYDGTCRRLDPDEAARRVAAGEKHVIRFKMPQEGSITVHDRLRGDIVVENKTLDDYILIRSNGLAVYHLAAMVDDYTMKVTHVFRGSEWLSTFPLHVHIVRAFGWLEPEWVHLSVFLKPSGKGKMSKRESYVPMKGGYSIFVKDLEDLGYLPEATNNWIALMGWSYDDRTEFFTMQDLIDKFNLDNLNPAPAAINFSKLDHFNGLHIRSLPVPELALRLKPFFQAAGYNPDMALLLKITRAIQERIVTLDDGPAVAGVFFKEQINPRPEDLIGKDMTAAESAVVARRCLQGLESLPDITPEHAEPPMRHLIEEMGLNAGQVFGILRLAVTGQTVSPPLFDSMEIIGREKVLERIRYAIKLLENLTPPEA